MRKCLWLMVAISLFLSLFAGCAAPSVEEISPSLEVALPEKSNAYGIRAAVVYDAAIADSRWQDTMDYLEQSVILGLEAEAVDVTEDYDLSAYDMVIPDATLVESTHMPELRDALTAYTEQGGYVLLENRFCEVMPMDYLGISTATDLGGCPLDMTYPEVGHDLGELQQVIADFASLYPEYYEAETLLQQDYGHGFVADTATVLAEYEGQAVYTFHNHGNGAVMLTNPLLPNIFSLGNYAMTHRDEGETAFAGTTASCNQLLYSRFASLVAKEKYGYALNRVYGYHGSPSMAWELHYEEITAYANNAMKVFDDLCREYSQVPSYTIIRNSYWWFLRAESVTYLKNQSKTGYDFQMDLEESAYSSGTHIASNGQWLSLGKIEDAGSYFRDYPEYNYRAYPCFADVDGDGEAELLSGSYDGAVYCYDNLSYSDRLHVFEAVKLPGVQVSGFSAPQMADIDGDGALDLLVGSSDGNIYWYKDYVNQGVLLRTDIPGQVLPNIGDINGDDVPDLIVGSDQGVLVSYYGKLNDDRLTFDWQDMSSWSKLCANEGLGKFLAPSTVDWNGDGLMDLAVGTFDGYIALLLGDGEGQMTFGGYMEAEEMNYKGNHNLKFGNYCVPTFFDVDGDGADDLVCGSLEYGMAYPIDSPYFPYEKELQAQLDYAQENHQYLGIHHYSNAYSSAEREAYELRRHKESFDHYGVPTEGIGANAHTWYTSTLGDTLTFDAEFDAGLLWNSGFSAPGDPGAAPQYAAENVIALPFFLQREGEDSLLIQSNSVLPYVDPAWTDLSAKYKMPVCVYYHCDFVYENDAGARVYLQKVSDFQYRYGYNFLREDQLMEATLEARNLAISAQLVDGRLSIVPQTPSNVGVEVAFAETVDASAWHTDAKVWHREGNSLYVSLGEGVDLFTEESPASVLRQVNLPANISLSDGEVTIEFLDDGMLQVVTEPGCITEDAGWTVTEKENCTVFTKYGEADTLHLKTMKE